MSGGPFRLTTNVLRRGAYEFTLDKVPEDKRGLLHNALLNFGRIKWTITNEEDIQFLSTLIKENQQIDMLYLRISTTIDISQLAGAIERSNIGDVELDRDCESDISPLLKALGKVARLKKFTLWYSIFPQEYEALACAIRNEHLEELYISIACHHFLQLQFGHLSYQLTRHLKSYIYRGLMVAQKDSRPSPKSFQKTDQSKICYSTIIFTSPKCI